MRTESYEILMPEKARLMTEEEMEYEGGWLNTISLKQFAYQIAASYGGEPVLDPPHGSGDGYLPHYHVHDHRTSAHMFFH